jgi:hypothetical protein
MHHSGANSAARVWNHVSTNDVIASDSDAIQTFTAKKFWISQ